MKVFEDLQAIQTFGFRGEALASISYVSHVTVTTKTPGSVCAYKAKYLNGKLIPQTLNGKKGHNSDPKPCAGMNGTIITVEDLFYNLPSRKQAFKDNNEQYAYMLDILTRYSIHYGDKHISFTCKRTGTGNCTPDLCTPNASSTLNNIRLAYGEGVAQHLIEFKYECPCTSYTDSSNNNSRSRSGGHLSTTNIENDHDHDQDDEPTYNNNNTNTINTSYNNNSSDTNSGSNNQQKVYMKGYITNTSYNNKRLTLILFINNRLVESNSIKKVIDTIYIDMLPKQTHPLVYISLIMPPEHVDVNVHPTKKEVHFLYEEKILEYMYIEMRKQLVQANQSRQFVISNISTLLGPFSSSSSSSAAVAVVQQSSVNSNMNNKGHNSDTHADGIVVLQQVSQQDNRGNAVTSSSSSYQNYEPLDQPYDTARPLETAAAHVSNTTQLNMLAAADRSDDNGGALLDDNIASNEYEYDRSDGVDEAATVPLRQPLQSPYNSTTPSDSTVGDDARRSYPTTSASSGDEDSSPSISASTYPLSSLTPSFTTTAGHTNSGQGASKRPRSQPTSSSSAQPQQQKPAHKLVRTDPTATKLQAYFKPITSTSAAKAVSDDNVRASIGNQDSTAPATQATYLKDTDHLLAEEGQSFGDDRGAFPQACPCCPRGRGDGEDGYTGGTELPFQYCQTINLPLKSNTTSNLQSASHKPVNFSHPSNSETINIHSTSTNNHTYTAKYTPTTISPSTCTIPYIRNKIDNICTNKHDGILHILKNNTFIGYINSIYCLIQYDTKIILINYQKLCYYICYQLCYRQIQNFRVLKCGGIDIRACLTHWLTVEYNNKDKTRSNDNKDSSSSNSNNIRIVDKAMCILLYCAAFLHKYFSIHIDTDTYTLLSLPDMLLGYDPIRSYLPMFLFRLASTLQRYTNNKGHNSDLLLINGYIEEDDNNNQLYECIVCELSYYYSYLPVTPIAPPTKADNTYTLSALGQSIFESYLYPIIKAHIYPDRKWMAGNEAGATAGGKEVVFTPVASLEKLYKVFERC